MRKTWTFFEFSILFDAFRSKFEPINRCKVYSFRTIKLKSIGIGKWKPSDKEGLSNPMVKPCVVCLGESDDKFPSSLIGGKNPDILFPEPFLFVCLFFWSFCKNIQGRTCQGKGLWRVEKVDQVDFQKVRGRFLAWLSQRLEGVNQKMTFSFVWNF